VKIADASLAVKWLVPEDDSPRALSLLVEWMQRGEQMVAPHLLPLEVTNSLRQKMRRRNLPLNAARSALDQLLALPILLLPDLAQRRPCPQSRHSTT
jgi:predicted nucleic acid-binding protein